MEEEGSLLETLVKKIKHAELHFMGKLGEGSFGTVKKGRWKGQDVAIKTVRRTRISTTMLKKFKAEIKKLKER